MPKTKKEILDLTYPVDLTLNDVKKKGITNLAEDELYYYILVEMSDYKSSNPNDRWTSGEDVFYLVDKATGKVRKGDIPDWLLLTNNLTEKDPPFEKFLV